MTVECVRLGSNEASINWLMRFFLAPEITQSMPDGDKSLASVYNAAKALENGFVIAYCPMMDGEPLGLFWGKFINDFCVLAHWGLLKEFQKKGVALAASKAAIDAVKKDFPMVTSIMGTISKNNIRCYAGALKAGFTANGTLPKSHTTNGKIYDSWIVVKEI